MRRLCTVVVVAGLLGPTGGAGAAPPKPGKVLLERNGVIERSTLRVTQDTFVTYNKCRGTDLNGTETNGLSAFVLDVAKYAGQHLAVAYTDSLSLGTGYNVRFYSHDCQQVSSADFTSSIPMSKEGRIPGRAVWLVLSRGGPSPDYLTPATDNQLVWKATIRALAPLPKSPAKALCQQVRDPKGDDSDGQLDILSADVAVDATAVTVALRLAAIDVNDALAPVRAYLVEFTVDGKTLFLGMNQQYPGTYVAGIGLRPVYGTKDAAGYRTFIAPVTAWFDTTTGEMRVSAPLTRPATGTSMGTLAKFDRGKKLTGITARTVTGAWGYTWAPPPAYAERDVATTGSAYVVGTPTCLQPVVD